MRGVYTATLCIVLLVWSLSVNGEFLDALILKDVAKEYEDTGETDPGWTEFELVEKYRYRTPEGGTWIVPKGYVVDGASIPKSTWSIIGGPWSGRYRNAAVLHDWMCDETISNSNYVHRLFYDVLLESGVNTIKAKIMYIAVRKYGPQWEKATGFGLKPEVYRPVFDQSEFDALVDQVRQKNSSIDQINNLIDNY
ncbi:MAG: DUF1353 domain-containing protein [Candidatus Thiodiazotropha sp.]